MGRAGDAEGNPVIPAVFLDRDGVINRVLVREDKPYPPQTLQELDVLPGVPYAISNLKRAGFRIIVVTNQPDVATGVQQRDVVEAMHAHLLDTLEIDEIRVCFHVDSDGCSCRKPRPGMLLDAVQVWGIDIEQSYMVGDRWRDIGAGKAAGCRTILLRNTYDEQQAENPDAVVDSLLEATKFILNNLQNDSKLEIRG